MVKDYPKLRLTQGRKVCIILTLFYVQIFQVYIERKAYNELPLQVLEIRPTIKWDKGKALEFLLEALGWFNMMISNGM